jgi:hypothetical protein
MYFLTLGDLKKAGSPLSRVSGLCSSTDSRFPSYVNEAVRKLMKRGDWANTVVPIQVCIRRGCVTWPRYVGSVRRINLCGTPVPVTNIWSRYLERDIWPRWYDFPGLIPWGELGQHSGLYNRGWGSSLRYTDSGITKTGHYSTYSDPLGTHFVRAYPQYPQDAGKTVTIFGKDENGQPLQTKVTASDGTVTYKPGHIITMQGSPTGYGSSSVLIQPPIERVIKDETQGQVYLYSYDPDNDLLFDLAVYEPSETNPCYERTAIPGRAKDDGTTTDTIMALVKLKHVDVVHDTDLITVPDVDALKVMIQSALFDEADDPDRADQYEAKAIRELNLMLRDTYPEDQTDAAVEPFNSTGIGHQKTF